MLRLFSDDFVADIGAARTDSAIELLYARQKIVAHAKAFGMQAIDLVHINFKDLQGLREQSLEGSNMGFTGKQVIDFKLPYFRVLFPRKLFFFETLESRKRGNFHIHSFCIMAIFYFIN